MSKWGVLVLSSLSDGTRRWGELRRDVDGISEKMLASTLKTLSSDGLGSIANRSRPAALTSNTASPPWAVTSWCGCCRWSSGSPTTRTE